MCHVVAIADIGDLPAREIGAEDLAHGEEVRQALTGMEIVGQSVDHRNRSVDRQIDHILMRERSRHDAVDEACQHLGSIGDRLTPPELDVIARQKQGVTTELGHPDLEADPRPGRGLLEDHPQAAAFEHGREPLWLGLHLGRQIEDPLDLGSAQVVNRDQVAFAHARSLA